MSDLLCTICGHFEDAHSLRTHPFTTGKELVTPAPPPPEEYVCPNYVPPAPAAVCLHPLDYRGYMGACNKCGGNVLDDAPAATERITLHRHNGELHVVWGESCKRKADTMGGEITDYVPARLLEEARTSLATCHKDANSLIERLAHYQSRVEELSEANRPARVLETIRVAVEQERERCAKIAEDRIPDGRHFSRGGCTGLKHAIAAKIREGK